MILLFSVFPAPSQLPKRDFRREGGRGTKSTLLGEDLNDVEMAAIRKITGFASRLRDGGYIPDWCNS
jgi:hypothetical protein